MSKWEKIGLAYLAAGVLVRLSGRSLSATENFEETAGTIVFWPLALYSGTTILPAQPTVPVYDFTAPATT